MQNKGIVKFIALVLILVCCFYLSFSFVTRYHENKAAAMSEEAGQEYLDSIMNEKVYCGIYSFKQCREMEIGLGLDLKGGMNVILEVSVPDVVDVLADHKTDAAYKKSMEEAKKEEETSQNDFISLLSATVSISSVSYSPTSRSWKDRAVVSWSRCLVSRSPSVSASCCREVPTSSSGRPITLRRLPPCCPS